MPSATTEPAENIHASADERAVATADYRVNQDVAFPRLDDEDLRRVHALAVCQTFNDGDPILHMGDADIDLIVIEAGTVEIRNPMNKDALIVTHGPGGFIGDIDLLTRRPIIYDAIARGDGKGGPTRVLRVPGSKLRFLLNAVPRLSEKVIEAIQARRAALPRSGVVGVRVIGAGGCGSTNIMREFLHKNFVPFTWIDADDNAGRDMLKIIGGPTPSHGNMPVVDIGKGDIMRNPSLQEVAHKAGVWRGCPTGVIDLAIVGGGPAGIAAAVYAASEGLSTVVLDRLGPGGQAGGSSRIENFIGFPSGLSGNDLATRGVLQMLKFGANMVAPVNVGQLQVGPTRDAFDGDTDAEPHRLPLDCGATIEARIVLAATGVTWRRLAADGAEKFERAGVYYACTAVEALLYDEDDVVVIGGGNSAGQAIMFLAEKCRSRTCHLLVRRPLGAGMSEYLVSRIRGQSNIKVHEGVEVSAIHGSRKIEVIDLVAVPTGDAKIAAGQRDSSPEELKRRPVKESVKCAAVFVFIGAEPRSEWLPDTIARDKNGYILTGSEMVRQNLWPLKHRSPCPLETSVPRVLAGGDLRSGSTKRVGFAVGDGSLAVTCVHSLLAGIRH